MGAEYILILICSRILNTLRLYDKHFSIFRVCHSYFIVGSLIQIRTYRVGTNPEVWNIFVQVIVSWKPIYYDELSYYGSVFASGMLSKNFVLVSYTSILNFRAFETTDCL